MDDLETNNLTEEEKSVLAFDRAIDILNSYFKDKKWDGFPIHSHKVPCTGGPVMYDDGPVQDRILSAAQKEYKAD